MISLVEAAKSGNQDAMEKLYNLYMRKIYNFIFTMVKDEDEVKDLTQETFFKAFVNIKKLRNNNLFEQWLYKIARNEILQFMKRKKRFVSDGEMVKKDGGVIYTTPVDERVSPEKNTLNKELGVIINEAIDSLPVKQKEVFVLSVIHKKSYAEISEIVNRSLLSVKSDIFRARSSVKDYIKKRMGN